MSQPSATREETLARRRRSEYLRGTGRSVILKPGPEVDQAKAKIRAFHEKGMPYRLMAEQVPMNQRSIAEWLQPRRKSGGMYRETYNAVMAMTLVVERDAMNGALVTPVGTMRRLRAMWYDGFSLEEINTMIGLQRKTVTLKRIVRGERPAVRPGTVTRVSELYDKLEFATPTDFGIPVHTQNWVRGWAVKQGAAPRISWVGRNIDDPDEFPDWTGQCGTPFGAFFHRHEKSLVCGPCEAAEKPVRFSGDLLKEMRERVGLSQRGMEAELGLTKGHVHHWESGRYAPRRAVLDGLMSYFDVTVEDLYEIEEA